MEIEHIVRPGVLKQVQNATPDVAYGSRAHTRRH